MFYFPSCNFTRIRPEVSARIKAYMAKTGADIMGCCRPGHKKIDSGETAVTICQTCNIIIAENRPDVKRKSLYEVIDEDSTFAFPDYRGECMTVQDCFRAKENLSLKKAVRSLLKKMNVKVEELSGTEEEAGFDGTWLRNPVRERNMAIAPVYFSEIAKKITIYKEDENARYMKEYCGRFETVRVVCYCNSCLTGLEQGLPEKKHAVHLAELLFPV